MSLLQVRTHLEEAVFGKDVVLWVGPIRAGPDPARLNLELAENILLEDLTNGTFRRAPASIDHVKRTAAEALRVRNQIFVMKPICNFAMSIHLPRMCQPCGFRATRRERV